jgi:lipoate-protein ligase A
VGPAPNGDSTYAYLAGGLRAGLARLGVTAEIARHDGPAGPVCMATQQGADLRVGDRKVCGSAQVQRGAAVLQHGSILLDRLAFDETDLVVGEHDRAALQAATVTLAELDAPHDPRVVADAVLEGFVAALDLDFTVAPSSLTSTSSEG